MADRYWVSPNTIVQFSVAAQETVPTGLFFKPDGTKMYIIGSDGDDINEYDLSVAWSISTSSFLQNFSISAQETLPTGLFFKPDGTKMYVVGLIGIDVNEYNLSAAWDISTASYLQNFSVSAQESNPQGLFFKPDGTKMYVAGLAGDDVNEYNLSVAWDISTASYLQNFSVAAQENSIVDISFKADGLKMYVLGRTGIDVNEYNLSVAWDISTASYLQNFSVSAQETTPSGLFFKDDGTKMYLVGTDADSVFSYPLSTAWNISTITIDTWNGTAGLKWASTSGGAGGQSVPTTADDVFFDANSLGIVTVASDIPAMKSLNFTGFIGTITGTGALLVGGNFTVSTGMSYGHSGTLEIRGTGTVITAGKAIRSLFKINGSGITVTLGDALNVSFGQSILVDQGTFDTAGYNVTTTNLVPAGGAAITINLNASTVSLGINLTFTNATNLTLNAGTSQINLNNASSIFAGNSKTFYNVTFTNSATGVRSITGANTFNNLTLNAIGNGLSELSIDNNQTVNGTLTCAGSSSFARGFVRSFTLGTVRTITAAAVSATDCDFRDITIAGAAAPISPTRGGDCGGNSGITFPAAKNSYRVGTDTSWRGSNSWALTSGGTGDNNNFPLAQDTAVIDNNTALTGTLSTAICNMGSLDCSARTSAITLNFSSTLSRYGFFTLGSGITVSGTSAQTFSGRGTQTFTSAGKTITFSITVDKPAGAFELGDAYNSSSTVTHTNGTFDAKTYNLSCLQFNSNNTNTRTINMGTGLWTVSRDAVGGSAPWLINGTNLTLNKQTANILLSGDTTSSRDFNGGGKVYNKLTIGGTTSISTTSILVADTFSELASTKTTAHTIRFCATAGTITTWSVTGTVGNVVTVDSNIAATRRTFTLTNSTAGLIDYLSVKDIGITSPNLFYVGNNSTNGGNNLNVYFTSFPALNTGNMFFMFN